MNSAERSFQDDLRLLSGKLNATLVFDAVGGRLTREIMQVVPADSDVVLYGNLSGRAAGDRLQIPGFGQYESVRIFSGTLVKESRTGQNTPNIFRVRALLKTGLSITVRARIPLEECRTRQCGPISPV